MHSVFRLIGTSLLIAALSLGNIQKARAEACIFSGDDVECLRENLSLNGSVKFLSGSTNPSSSAVDAPKGSLYMNTSNGNLYVKQDAGSSTNWTQLAFSGGAGEANTASNVGTAGVGVFDGKSGVDLQFRKLNPASNKCSISLDAGNQKIDFDINEANLTLSNLGGAVTDAQVPNTITLDNITQITARSHTDLSDIGTNTHAQIDTHIAGSSSVHGVSGSVVGTSDTQTLSSKKLVDASTSIIDDGDNTKIAQFQASSIATATTRTYTLPNASGEVILHDANQTLSNKFFNSNNIQWFDNTDSTKRAKWDLSGAQTGRTFTFKPVISGANVTATLTVTDGSTNVSLLTNRGGVVDGSLTVDSDLFLFESGLSGSQLLLDMSGGSVGAMNILQHSPTGFGTITLPDGTYTITGNSLTQTLTNKTINADSNTITNIEDADIKAGANIARSKIAAGTANHVVVNDGSGNLSSVAPGTSGNVLTSNGTSWVSSAPTGGSGAPRTHITLATSVLPNVLAAGAAPSDNCTLALTNLNTTKRQIGTQVMVKMDSFANARGIFRLKNAGRQSGQISCQIRNVTDGTTLIASTNVTTSTTCTTAQGTATSLALTGVKQFACECSGGNATDDPLLAYCGLELSP